MATPRLRKRQSVFLADYVANAIHSARIEAGYEVKKLAFLLSTSLSVVRNYEGAITMPTLARLYELADVLNVDAKDLLPTMRQVYGKGEE